MLSTDLTCHLCGRDYRGNESDLDIYPGAPCPESECPANDANKESK